MSVAADWLGWLFLLDDQLDEGAVGRDPVATRAFLRPLTTVCGEQPQRRAHDGGPLSDALRDIWRRMAAAMPLFWRRRFARHLLEYLEGCTWEAANRALHRIPDLAVYPSRRRTAGAIWPALDVLEFVAHAPLPDRLLADPSFAEMCRAAADVICWTDDVLTVGKERARGDVHNFVIVLEHATGCTAEDAAAEVTRRIDRRLGDFLAGERRLAGVLDALPADPEVRRHAAEYVAGLRNWMRGHLEWGLRTDRYQVTGTAGTDPGYLENLS
ncbi:hypothetical protein F3087_40545 [Nocardia colli]|uniref:Terpene synthase n=1 Tax=Nocardia colli TaxID=2545717 RepID=A0A5N0DW81_9NOCA|nr:terpene synthase family protein [Nocardia colli]KAA8880610.1 hypothetical protein F3087_40545 [Nocardia colli]